MTWNHEVQAEMNRARGLHPSNHLLLSAFSEEAGEVVKAVLDQMAGKATLSEVRAELIQAGAMVGRLLEEGDPVHGLPAPLGADEVRCCSHVDETEAVNELDELRDRLRLVEFERNKTQALWSAEKKCHVEALMQRNEARAQLAQARAEERQRAVEIVASWTPEKFMFMSRCHIAEALDPKEGKA